MSWVLGVWMATGEGLILLGLYWVFTEKYEPPEDRLVRVALAAGGMTIALGLAATFVWRLWAIAAPV